MRLVLESDHSVVINAYKIKKGEAKNEKMREQT